jgi:hypothetical protein
VRRAYLILLGRDADVGGQRQYLARIREGASKWRILESLSGSPEFASAAARRASVVSESHGAGRRGAEREDPLPALDDIEFALGAHMLLTGNKPGPQAAAELAGRLRDGLARPECFAEIARSPAALAHRELLTALAGALRRQQWARVPVVGRLLAPLLGLEGASAAEVRMRRLENEFHRLSASSNPAASGWREASDTKPPAPGEPEVLLRPYTSVASRLASLPTAVNDANGKGMAR